MVGAMHGALDATVAYAKTREQFGQPIGANQVVKHRLVNMAIKVEEARSLALLAAVRCSDGSPENVRARAVSSAKVQISALARAVTEDAVQLHGAMGVTDELQIGDALKRAIAFEASYGTSRWHRTRYAALRATRETA
jgi:alkylation response protein AidB-like acyl-CoA dehydrogenase